MTASKHTWILKVAKATYSTKEPKKATQNHKVTQAWTLIHKAIQNAWCSLKRSINNCAGLRPAMEEQAISKVCRSSEMRVPLALKSTKCFLRTVTVVLYWISLMRGCAILQATVSKLWLEIMQPYMRRRVHYLRYQSNSTFIPKSDFFAYEINLNSSFQRV